MVSSEFKSRKLALKDLEERNKNYYDKCKIMISSVEPIGGYFYEKAEDLQISESVCPKPAILLR